MTDVLRIWEPSRLPLSWVIENETTGELFVVPAVQNGRARYTATAPPCAPSWATPSSREVCRN